MRNQRSINRNQFGGSNSYSNENWNRSQNSSYRNPGRKMYTNVYQQASQNQVSNYQSQKTPQRNNFGNQNPRISLQRVPPPRPLSINRNNNTSLSRISNSHMSMNKSMSVNRNMNVNMSMDRSRNVNRSMNRGINRMNSHNNLHKISMPRGCLLYTSPSPRD